MNDVPVPKCDVCDHDAVVNYCTVIKKFAIVNGEYGEGKTIDTVESSHYCAEHDN